MMRTGLLAFRLSLIFGVAATPAYAGTTLFSLAIGYNGLPPQAPASSLSSLRYADDDALAIHELARRVGRRSVVLTIPDRETQTRFPSASEARPPSLTELRRVLVDLKANIERATRDGDDVAIWIFYSGHGWLDDHGRASLTLADGALSQDMLHDEVLPALPASTVHLIIDACHAEAMIRSRDVTAGTVLVSPVEVVSASLHARLAQLPNLGVIMASVRNTQAHEWDEYQTGVFTHEFLSGLRGGADVDHDGRVEYSEMAAFLAAANRSVTDPRAHLTTLVVAPKLHPRVAIIDTNRTNSMAHLVGDAHHLGHFQVDDQRGTRLLDLHTEPGFLVDLVLPAGERILLSNAEHEVELLPSVEHPTDIQTLSLQRSSSRSRGVLSRAMQRGLFATAFGPSYYQGFVDNGPQHMIPVELSPPGIRAPAASAPRRESHRMAWTAFATGAASLAASGVLAILAARAYRDYSNTDLERPSAEARDRYATYGIAAIGTLTVSALSMGLGYWLWSPGPAGNSP